MASSVEEIKSRLNIVDIAGEYLKLEKAGGNFKARCPFHNERTPSFVVSSSRQSYHCFGCNRGGDIISLVQEIEGIDFLGALKILADRAGVVLTREHAATRDTERGRESLYKVLELATKFYEAVLPKFPEALVYLHKRGITDESIKTFRIGFAPDEWRSLSDVLLKKNIQETLSDRAGLITRSPKGFYDRFRGRIMFPIADTAGRIIAFSGRVLKDEPGKTLGTSSQAKYVNSPETEVFHKSRALFGFHQAKDAMRRLDSAVLVEGQIDLVMSHQAGVTNTVASSGTALTAEHLGLIKRFTQNIVLAFDADDAGLAAAHKAILLALGSDMSVRIAEIPQGLDPADLIQKNPDLWKNAITEAQPVVDFYLKTFPTRFTDQSLLRKKVSEIIIPFVAALKSSLDQGHYVGRIATLLGIQEGPVWDEIKKVALPQENIPPDATTPWKPLSRLDRLTRSIEGLLLWQEGVPETNVSGLGEMRRTFDALLKEHNIEHSPPDQHEEEVFEAEIRFEGNANLTEELKLLLKTLGEEILRERFTRTMKELKHAEAEGDIAKAQELLKVCQEISKELHAITTKTS